MLFAIESNIVVRMAACRDDSFVSGLSSPFLVHIPNCPPRSILSGELNFVVFMAAL
jgi:hypothetical protein